MAARRRRSPLLLVLLAAGGLLACGTPSGELPVMPRPRAGERILIVAPHVDDEAIAAAGYTVDALAAGAEVFVVYLTAGDGGFVSAEYEGRTLWPRPKDYLREGTIRIGEAHAVMALLDVPEANLFVLGYPDGDLLRMVESQGLRLRWKRLWIQQPRLFRLLVAFNDRLPYRARFMRNPAVTLRLSQGET